MSSDGPSIHVAPAADPSIWDRVTTWAADNKAIAYTIAGVVVVVTGAGAVYYLSESKKSSAGKSIPGEKRKSKKQRQKEKKASEEAKSSTIGLKDEEAGMEALCVPLIIADLHHSHSNTIP